MIPEPCSEERRVHGALDPVLSYVHDTLGIWMRSFVGRFGRRMCMASRCSLSSAFSVVGAVVVFKEVETQVIDPRDMN